MSWGDFLETETEKNVRLMSVMIVLDMPTSPKASVAWPRTLARSAQRSARNPRSEVSGMLVEGPQTTTNVLAKVTTGSHRRHYQPTGCVVIGSDGA